MMPHENDGQLQEVLDTVAEELESQSPEPNHSEEDIDESEEGREHAVAKQPNQSFRELRDQKKKAEEERDYYARQLAELAAQQRKPEKRVEEELLFEGDDYAERNDLKRIQGDYNNKIKAMDRKIYELTVENQIRNKYPDYYDVVNTDTLRMLAQKKPELGRVLANSTDLHDQAVAAYEAVKEHVFTATPSVERIQQKAQSNLKKPTLTGKQATAPGSFAFADQIMNGDMTPELEKYLREEIERNSRRRA